jgi:hypothetical protein
VLQALSQMLGQAACEGVGFSSVLRIFFVPIFVCYVSLIEQAHGPGPSVLRHITCYVIWQDLHRFRVSSVLRIVGFCDVLVQVG